MLQVGPEATGVPVNEQVESVEDHIEPETVTTVPIGLDVGLSVSVAVGLVTVNVA